MKNDTQPLKIGYLNYTKKSFISSITINNSFLGLLNQFAKVKIISINNKNDILSFFKKIESYNFDYFYVDSYTFLLDAFLLRLRYNRTIPFILKLHTIARWSYRYIYIIPLIDKNDIVYANCLYAKRCFKKLSDKITIETINFFADIHSLQKNNNTKKNKNKKRISFLGRLTKEKGADILIECLPKILKHIPNAHLDIIGPLSGSGTKDTPICDYVKAMKQKVKKLNLESFVTFHGAKFGDDKYTILKKSDVFINPTTALGETFPQVNIEALASGIPVIATDWGGNREIIVTRENGYLIKTYTDKKAVTRINNKDLIESVLKTLKDEKTNQTMKKNALASAKQYDYHKVIPEFIKLLGKNRNKNIKPPIPWEKIKEKTVIDFKHFFTKDIIFFLYFQNDFRNQTYKELYEKVVGTKEPKKSFPIKTLKKKTRLQRKEAKAVIDKLHAAAINLFSINQSQK